MNKKAKKVNANKNMKGWYLYGKKSRYECTR